MLVFILTSIVLLAIVIASCVFVQSRVFRDILQVLCHIWLFSIRSEFHKLVKHTHYKYFLKYLLVEEIG